MTRPVRWSGYVKQQERISSCGSRHFCTTATNLETLRMAYFRLKNEAAPGVDGETWRHYREEVCHPYPPHRMGVVTYGKSRIRGIRSSGSVEGVVSNHDPYSDSFAVPQRPLPVYGATSADRSPGSFIIVKSPRKLFPIR